MLSNPISKLASGGFALRSNVIASFAANVIPAILTLISVPLYIGYVGVEAYALVGLFASMQAVFAVLDLGFSATITRELAGDDRTPSGKRDLLRTAEVIYWGIALVAATLGILASPLLSGYVNSAQTSGSTLHQSFLLIAVSLGLQFPVGMYSAALLGMQRQVALGSVNVAFSVIRVGGTLLALNYVLAAPQTIFAWHAVSSALQVALLAVASWASMPVSDPRPNASLGVVRPLWKFTAAITGITLMSALLTQIDKLVLARVLTLEAFGYYAIAAAAAGSVGRFIQPVFQVYFPRLTQLSSQGRLGEIAGTYHQGSQLVTVLVMPVAGVCILFPREVLTVWQGNAEIASSSAGILAVLMAGSALNALMFIPYSLLLAKGKARFYFFVLAAAVAVSVPATVLLAAQYGGEGAAWVWFVLNAAFILFVVPVIHERSLPGESRRWYVDDVLLPAAAVFAVAIAARSIFPASDDRITLLTQLCVSGLFSFAAGCSAAAQIRRPLLKMLGLGPAS